MNLFWSYITADDQVDDFVKLILKLRNNPSLITSIGAPKKFKTKIQNGINGTIRIAREAGIIELGAGHYQLVKS